MVYCACVFDGLLYAILQLGWRRQNFDTSFKRLPLIALLNEECSSIRYLVGVWSSISDVGGECGITRINSSPMSSVNSSMIRSFRESLQWWSGLLLLSSLTKREVERPI